MLITSDDMTAAARRRRKTVTRHPKGGAPDPAPLPDGGEARFVIDEHGHIVHASPAFAALAGQPPEKLRGQPLSAVLEFADPDEALRAQALFGRGSGAYIDAINEGEHKVLLFGAAAPAGAVMRFDLAAARDGGRYIVATESRGRPAALPGGRFIDQVLALLDRDSGAVPETKISPASAEGELGHFLNMSNDLMAAFSPEGFFSRVNGTFNDALGYSDEELRALGFLDLVYTDDRPHVRGALLQIMRDDSGRVIDFETRVTARKGHLLWTEWRMKSSQGAIYAVGRDVTAIKEHESALRRQRGQLDEAQAIGRMGHWRWTVGAGDIEWSDEIYRIFGVDRASFCPGLDKFEGILHKRDVGRLLQAFQRAIIEQNNYEMEFRITRPGGETRYIRCEGRCEKDANGEVVALFGIMQDITEGTLHERDLREAKDAAERAYAAKSQFLANMSHELRTPLNAIIGFSEMMQRQLLGPIGTEKYLDYIAGIRESGEHLLDLISDILDMSKIEAGKYELDLEQLQLAKIMRLAVHMMEGRAQEGKIRLGVSIANEDQIITADRRAVMQILLNLLSNAVKFTDPGGSVHVECIDRPDHILIRVTDTGIGIPAHKIQHITRPFEQAASHYTREHEGTGLGLAITKDLTELHGGILQIESTVGVGTTVTVRLPQDATDHVRARKEKQQK